MPERVKKIEGKLLSVLCDLERVLIGLAKLEKIGFEVEKISENLQRHLPAGI